MNYSFLFDKDSQWKFLVESRSHIEIIVVVFFLVLNTVRIIFLTIFSFSKYFFQVFIFDTVSANAKMRLRKDWHPKYSFDLVLFGFELKHILPRRFAIFPLGLLFGALYRLIISSSSTLAST